MGLAYNVHDYREKARQRLPKGLFEFVDRGTEDEHALRRMRDAFDAIELSPSVLTDVSKRTAKTNLFGREWSYPLAIAPTGVAGLMWYEGELALAKAAAAAGIPFTLATGSLTSIEKVAAEAGGNLWFQLYVWPDKKQSYALIERARLNGFETLVVTVDTAVPSNREYNFRNGFTVPFSLSWANAYDVLTHPRWLLGVLGRYVLTTGMPRYENYPSSEKRRVTAAPVGRAMPKTDMLTWDDFRDLRKAWPHKLLVKGILRREDALRAVDIGADGVIVSTHGGRILDSAIPSIRALPGVVDAVGNRVPVLVDSGIRRGSDIVKALALGASAVLAGRGPLYGVAVEGQPGAARVLEMLHQETLRVMGLVGKSTVQELTRDILCTPGPSGSL
ncbi:alpha-hydroxy acid oxidase [Ottowia caeni]|uniref:alpha-hydroxy acid oxidase n=1 Tax=Ottowia caeni TaxID=2870339 RepID=UPI001E3D57E6|nr:alpha-hydroxy-acid oxidizing protein [Ottowia caeni]